ncbi:MAG: ribosomal protein S18 acetylase RimI-like enzyme [Saprospiraceae bacterium]|jgi:ribosomal protein S18 acetylase RimI-like enzyme
MNIATHIARAEEKHVNEVARLFDLYRQFYECQPDLKHAHRFIGERIKQSESIIFIATDKDETGLGFVQMYPSFCSVEATKILILYDLYVDAGARKAGVGEALMNRATQYAKDSGATRLDLLTAFTNTAGQALYEKLGYIKANEDFHAYSLNL